MVNKMETKRFFVELRDVNERGEEAQRKAFGHLVKDFEPANPDHELCVYEVSEEGSWVDVNTGEVVGSEEFAHFVPTAFGADDAAFVLRFIRDKEARLVGAKAEKAALLNSVNANCNPRINRLTRSIEWAEKTYGPALEAFAKAEVDRANEGKPQSKWVKSWRCAYGMLAFVANKAGEIKAKAGRESELKAALLTLAPSGVRNRTVIKDEGAVWHALRTVYRDKVGEVAETAQDLDLEALKPEHRAAIFDALKAEEPAKVHVGFGVEVSLAELVEVTQPGTNRFDVRTAAKASKADQE